MFHIHLKNRRQQSGLSQKQIAEFLQISSQSISKWEKGEAKPSIDYLPALAECLNCEINDFFAPIPTIKETSALLSAFCELQMKLIHYGTASINDISLFVYQNPSILNIYQDFLGKLRQHQPLNLNVIQHILACTIAEAKLCLEYLIRFELVNQLDRTDNYLLIADSDAGQQLLKMYKDYGKHLLDKQRNESNAD